jgi:hypothetical protein
MGANKKGAGIALRLVTACVVGHDSARDDPVYGSRGVIITVKRAKRFGVHDRVSVCEMQ